jgi:hypothetical protein
MWSKLTNALKARSGGDHDTAATTTTSANQASSSTRPLSQFLSVGRSHGAPIVNTNINNNNHSETHLPLPLPSASPPSSPSRHGRMNLFKRHSRTVGVVGNDSGSFWVPAQQQQVPKRKSILGMGMNGGELGR